MKLVLKIWRQKSPADRGRLISYEVRDVSPNMSLLETLDKLNERLLSSGEEQIAFESDCREGICGSCGLMINGQAHGPKLGLATCQIYMRLFKDGDAITIEPFRARAFPVVKDLVIDRTAFDRIQTAGGFVSVNTGGAPDANTILVHKLAAEKAMDSAACIGCGACVAACPNASAVLFVGAKISHLSFLPQGQPERARRALAMVRAMDKEGFGTCSWEGECERACPKEIKIANIARLNREYLQASIISEEPIPCR
jgi:succinate dehydrogenase / fumarate reductase iron-sulfur subunit